MSLLVYGRGRARRQCSLGSGRCVSVWLQIEAMQNWLPVKPSRLRCSARRRPVRSMFALMLTMWGIKPNAGNTRSYTLARLKRERADL
jgi:hypothetical protein